MIVTVSEGKNNKIHIHIDGEYKATVDKDWWYSEKYRNYKEITEEELTELLCSVSFRRAYNKALDYLSRRPYSEKELAKKLREKDFPDEAIEGVIARLRELSLLNDETKVQLLHISLYVFFSISKLSILANLIARSILKGSSLNFFSALPIDLIIPSLMSSLPFNKSIIFS